MSEIQRPDVGKYGGESTPHFRPILEQDQISENHIPVMVLSAPGISEGWPKKLTDLMLEGGGFDVVRDCFEHVVRRFDPSGDHKAVQELMAELPEEFARWEHRGHPRAAFGEYWTARLYASYSGREFVDAADIISLDHEGAVDFEISTKAIRERFQNGRQNYVVPGFYGKMPDGTLRTLVRNSSDTTGAVIAAALPSRRYYKHIPEGGMHSGPPRVIPTSIVREVLTYREGREMSLGDKEILAVGAFNYLPGSGVETVICSNSGPRVPGTAIRDERDWRDNPIAGVTSKSRIVSMFFGRTGLNDEAGSTRAVFDALGDESIPYQDVTSGVDDVDLFIPGEDAERLDELAAKLGRDTGGVINLTPVSSIHLVGEGIADHRPLGFEIVGTAMMELARHGIGNYGSTNDGSGPGASIFVEPMRRGNGHKHPLRIAHDTLLPYMGVQYQAA